MFKVLFPARWIFPGAETLDRGPMQNVFYTTTQAAGGRCLAAPDWFNALHDRGSVYHRHWHVAADGVNIGIERSGKVVQPFCRFPSTTMRHQVALGTLLKRLGSIGCKFSRRKSVLPRLEWVNAFLDLLPRLAGKLARFLQCIGCGAAQSHPMLFTKLRVAKNPAPVIAIHLQVQPQDRRDTGRAFST